MTEVKVGCCVRATCDIKHKGILTVKRGTIGKIVTNPDDFHVVIGWLLYGCLPLGPHTLEYFIPYLTFPYTMGFELISDPPEILQTYPIPSAT